MDIVRLYRDFGVDHRTEGHKHCRPGWVNCECPFCTGNPGLHLGWNIQDEYFFCWRCGWHPLINSLSKILQNNDFEFIKKLLVDYGINRTVIKKQSIQKNEFKIPSRTIPAEEDKNVIKYLSKRKFNPLEICQKWNLKFTTPVSKLGNVNYKYRIIIPYFWNEQMVSFDSRDITEKQLNKYQACPESYEIIPRKSILYGKQEMWNPAIGICVEGPTDVWRLGELAFAVSGIQYTHEQIRVMANIFKNIAVVFDDDPQAQVQAKKLVAELKFRNVNAWNVQIKGDPGSLSEKESFELIKKIKEQCNQKLNTVKNT